MSSRLRLSMVVRRSRRLPFPVVHHLERRLCLSAVTFAPTVDLPVSGNPIWVATGDFNADGKSDFATANETAGTISIRLGNSSGAFTTEPDVSVAPDTNAVALADFNGDHILDLAVAGGFGTISIRLGNGDGTFHSPATPDIPVGISNNFTSISAGDFNNDHALDLVVTDNVQGFVTVLLGNGDGSFQAPANILGGLSPTTTALADFNGDGNLDIAVADYVGNAVNLFLGDGHGAFSTGPVLADSQPVTVVTADFNTDHKADLVVAGRVGTSVWLNNGSGTLIAQPDAPAGSTSNSVTVADFNNDGHPDLAVQDLFGNATVDLGDGHGNFSSAASIPLGFTGIAGQIAAGDFNGDGLLDLVTANFSGSTASVALQTASTPAQKIQIASTQIKGLVQSGTLNTGQGNALTSKLDAASSQITAGHPNAAAGQLNAFINQIEAWSGKKLTALQASLLTGEAQDILHLLH